LKITGKNEEVQAAPGINIANHNWDLINDSMKEMSTSFCFVSLPLFAGAKEILSATVVYALSSRLPAE
jgi:hypothetical protein